jgi:hypothetical protein
VARAEDDDHEQRIQDLERQNEELLRRLEEVEGTEDDALEQEVEDYLDEGLGLNLVIHRGNVHGIFQIFGHVGFNWNNPEIAGRSNGFFFSGGVDFFLTARAGDHFRMLSETVFTGVLSEPKDGGSFDQERLWGAWEFSDKLQIKLGLEHGPVSLWNHRYHHGKYLEMTIQRPFLARFEGGSGILPLHNAGLEFTGKFRAGAGRLGYVVIISNGRGRVATDTQEFSDRNDHKAVDLGLFFWPGGIDDLQVGIYFRVDKIPPNPVDADRAGSIDQLIGSFQLGYEGDRFEVLFEFAYIQNDDDQSGQEFGHYASYIQVAYLLRERWTPYTRFDVREMDTGDPYYDELNRDLDIWELLFGVRYDFIDNAALKFEVGFGENERRDGGVITEGGYVRIGVQLSWVF